MPPWVQQLGEVLTPGLLTALEIAWVLVAATWLLLERRSPAATVAWLLAMAALPLVGIPVYLLLGPRRLERKKLRMAMARRARTFHLGAWERLEGGWRDAWLEDPLHPQLARLATRLDVAPPETLRRADFYTDGDACYDALVAAIGAARHHVHAEYYIFRPGRAAARIRDALAERARAGVEVRLLVDAAGSASLGARFLSPLVEAGGQVAWFNRILLRRLRRPVPNFRTHRKILVVDGEVGFTGGMNVADDHSAAASGGAAWRDTHVRIEGAAVHGLQLTFLEDWTFATGIDPTTAGAGGAGGIRAWFPEIGPGPLIAQVVASGPDQEVSATEALYFAAIAGARRRVWLTTPYFVPSEPLLDALRTAALRGVDVQLVLARETDSALVDAAGRTFHDELIEAGARIHLFGPPMIHAKTCVVDDLLAVVGTANFDNRSFRLNFEVVVAFYGGAPVEEVARQFIADRAMAARVGLRESHGPIHRRLLASAARLLAPQL